MQVSICRKEVMTSVISPAERIPFPNHHYLMAEHNDSTHRLIEHMSLWTNCPGQAASNGSTGFRLLCERKARAETHMEKAAAITVRYRGSLQPWDAHFPGCNRQWCLKKHTPQDFYLSTSEQDKSPGPFTLEWLWMKGDHVWFYGHTVNSAESGDPALLLSSCDLRQVTSPLWVCLFIWKKEGEVKLDDLWGFF